MEDAERIRAVCSAIPKLLIALVNNSASSRDIRVTSLDT